MTVDRRFVAVLLLVLLVVVVAVALFRGPLGAGARDDGGPGGACPPGHVTTTGCSKP